jgi:hypothetical protein
MGVFMKQDFHFTPDDRNILRIAGRLETQLHVGFEPQ